jgi:hypothetical protein
MSHNHDGDGLTSAEIGQDIAAWAFLRRGDHSEIHLSRLELAAMLALAAETAINPELRSRVRNAQSPKERQDQHLSTFGRGGTEGR